jgi:glutamate-ammonia-ligase adenylyltransferase
MQDMPALTDLLNEATAQTMLQGYNFVDWKSAWTILKRLESRHSDNFRDIFSYLMSMLGSSADPDRSLVNFERLADGSGLSFFGDLKENPRLIEILVTIFSASPFLTEILLGTPDALDLLNQREALTERKTIEQYQTGAISAFQAEKTDLDRLNVLRRYQRRQLLRIGASDFLDLYDLRAVFSQLSRLAIGMVRACLALAVDQTGVSSVGFSILAMGKLGGWELNYSSDIDLLFIARQNDEDHFRLAKQLIENISRTTSEGFLYRVDLRLRPWGHDGPLITTVDGYIQYFRENALLWEKQAFLKARPIAGNLGLGEELRHEIEPYLFHIPQEEVRTSIFNMKKRTEEFLQEKGRQWGEVKLGKGSIRDIEFVVQSLQLTHPSIRTRSTLKAILRLREEALITPIEARTLSDGYIFLRTIEHHLQIIDYQQTYTLPSDPTALALLARRLGFEGDRAGERFTLQFEQHSRAIRAIFLKYIGNEPETGSLVSLDVSQKVLEHVDRMDASYTTTFSPEEITQHTQLAEELSREKPVSVNIQPIEGLRWRITVVGFDYLGELSLICGLMFLYGLDILESHAFTYEPKEASQNSNSSASTRQKIVDVFVVQYVRSESSDALMWANYARDLHALIMKLQSGKRREAQGELAKRVAAMFQNLALDTTPLYPIDIKIDNEVSKRYTVLEIGTTDTVGFLYEFSNALALSHINIVRMEVRSIGNRVNDTFYVTDNEGQKIIAPKKQRELRAATVLIKHFTHLLPHSPNPEIALLHFREFIAQLFERPNWPDELTKIDRPEVLNALAKLLGVSDFLWDDFLRMQYSNLFPIVRDVNALETALDHGQLEEELLNAFGQNGDWREAINAFKDRQMFRIDMRHILEYTKEFWDFSSELTDLAEVVITASFEHCYEELILKYGIPRLEDQQTCPVAIFALGKCGGRELGFASDIELMLIYAGQGNTAGPKSITNSGFFEELIQSIEKSFRTRQEGIFHIDLQLRPYGKAGSQAVSLDAFKNYYALNGPAWPYERQALVKLRRISGDHLLGEQVYRLRDQFIYNGEPFDITAMRAMRERQVHHLVTAGTFNAKYSPGGLADLEYLIQGLQITYGASDMSLRLTNTRLAMAALFKAGILSSQDYERLRKAHTFLRWLIDSIRVVRGNSKDVNIPPYNSDEFVYLARRLRYGSDIDRLLQDLSRYPLDVQELNQKLLPPV